MERWTWNSRHLHLHHKGERVFLLCPLADSNVILPIWKRTAIALVGLGQAEVPSISHQKENLGVLRTWGEDVKGLNSHYSTHACPRCLTPLPRVSLHLVLIPILGKGGVTGSLRKGG